MRTILIVILFLTGISDLAIGQDYKSINGLRMYYEIKGKGKPLLFIHGGGMCTEAYQQEINILSKRFRVIAADNQGQGRTNDIERKISYKNMALDQLALIDSLNIDSIIVFGHSDGGVVGLYMTLIDQNRIKKLIVSGSNFQADGILDEYTELLKGATPEIFQNDFYNNLSPDGKEHWPIVMKKLKTMWLNEPNISLQELNTINVPTLIIVGDNDIIKINHTVEMFKNIKNSNLLVFPNATHSVLIEKTDLIFPIILDFLEKK